MEITEDTKARATAVINEGLQAAYLQGWGRDSKDVFPAAVEAVNTGDIETLHDLRRAVCADPNSARALFFDHYLGRVVHIVAPVERGRLLADFFDRLDAEQAAEQAAEAARRADFQDWLRDLRTGQVVVTETTVTVTTTTELVALF